MNQEHTTPESPRVNKPGDHKDEAHDGHDHGHGNHYVGITIDGRRLEIHRGSYVVADLKRHIGVDATYELDEVIHGEFRPLADEGRITIKGDEIFISHVRTGSSS